MDAAKAGVRALRHRFGESAEADQPMAASHGRTVGVYIPVRRRPETEDLVAYREASESLQAWVRERGVSEAALVEEFDRLRKEKRRRG